MTWTLAPALLAAAWGAASGAVLPRVIARLPEPEPDPLVPAEDEADFARPVDEPKEPYVDLARLPGLAWKLAVVCAVLAGLTGARIGWSPALLFLGYLVPVGAALALVDWRTRYLPTRLIAPSYLVVGVLVLLGSVLTEDWSSLRSSAIGWVGCFAVFFVMWFISPGSMAYGDVRLAGLLGLAVGWLGLAQVVLGMFTGFLLLAVGGIVLSLARVFHRRHMPFGPFLLAGGFLGAVFPLQLLAGYAWVVEGVTSLVSSVVDAL